MMPTNFLRFFDCFRTPKSSPEMNQGGLQSSGRVLRETAENDRFCAVGGYSNLNQYKTITHIMSRSDNDISRNESSISSLTSHSSEETHNTLESVDKPRDVGVPELNCQQLLEGHDAFISFSRGVAVSPTLLQNLSKIHSLPENCRTEREKSDSFDSCSLIELPQAEEEFSEYQLANLTF